MARLTIRVDPSTHHNEKCIFQPPHNEMKCVLSIKEKEKMAKVVTNAYGQAGMCDPSSLMATLN